MRRQAEAALARGSRLPDELRLARQCAGTGERDRARAGAGVVGGHLGRGSAGKFVGTRAFARSGRGEVSRGGEGSQEAADPECSGGSERQLYRGGEDSGGASELFASLDSEP